MVRKYLILISLLLSLVVSSSAREKRKYEVGVSVSYGVRVSNNHDNHFGADFFGGYKPTEHIVVGAGLNYAYFRGCLLPSGIQYVSVQTDRYHAFRPFVYGKYDFTPSKNWSPYVGLKIGYGAFLKSKYSFNLLAGYDSGTTVNPEDYAYLRDMEHTLSISGNVYSSLDLGISRDIGKNGSKVSAGVSIEMQPLRYHYFDKTEAKTGVSIGPYIGFSF